MGQSTLLNSSSPHFHLSFSRKSVGGHGLEVCMYVVARTRVYPGLWGTYREIWSCCQSEPISGEKSFSFFHAPCTAEKKMVIKRLIGV